MTTFDPDDPTPAAPAASLGLPTFADLLAATMADRELALAKSANVKSALVTFCKRLHRHPAETLASSHHVRIYTEGVHHEQIGLSSKRWQNVLSDIRFAMDRHGPRPIRRLKSSDLVPPWTALMAQLPEESLRRGLSRFIKFCSVRNVAPEAVALGVFEAYETWLEAVESNKQPKQVAREAIKRWNRACTTVAGWPGHTIDLPPARDAYCLPWDKIDPAFRADAECYLARLGVDAWDDDDAPLRPLKPSSIESHRQTLRACYSILVRQGRAPGTITGLAELVVPETAAAIVGFLRERNGGRETTQLQGTASLLLAVARHHVKSDEAVIRKLQRMKGKVSPKRNGLTEKNKAAIRQFEELANVERLLMFPMELMKAADRIHNERPGEAALMAQTAVAIEILIMAAPRIGNLASIDLDADIFWRGETVLVSIAGERVKNGEDLEFVLEDESVALLRRYLDRYRPRLSNGTRWLFPGQKADRHKCRAALGRQIKATLFKHSGLDLTPHQFRHVAARLWLDENPGSYELLRQHLRHRSLETTTSNYAGFESRKATEHYDRFIWRQRSMFRQRRTD